MTLVAGLALAGCSGDDDEPRAQPAAVASPTAVGDRALVEVLDAGKDDRRVLALDLASGASSDATLDISQQVSRDDQSSVVPPISVPFTSLVTRVEGQGDDTAVTTTQTYGEPTIDASGLSSTDVAGVRKALSTLAGTTSTLVVRPDGTTVEATSSVDPASTVDAQLRELVAVLPTEAVGLGARWQATSVAQVDGAVVDQVATYTLTSLEGDTYGIDVTIEQTYRPGEVEGVEVRSGRGTVTARLAGTLGSLLPDRATGNVATQVSYVVGGQVTEVRTTVTLGLTAG